MKPASPFHPQYHPLPAATLLFIAGIWIAYYLRLPVLTNTAFGFGILALMLTTGLLSLCNRVKLFYMLMPLTIVLTGYFHASLHLQPPTQNNHVFHLITEPTETITIGTLQAMPEYDGITTSIVMRAEYLQRQGSEHLQRVSGNIQFRLRHEWAASLLPGDRLLVRAELKRPQSYRTPGSFDYARYLAMKDIWVNGYIRSPVLITNLKHQPGSLRALTYVPEQLRMKIGQQIDMALTDRTISSLYRAILIGDRSGVSNETLEAFKGSGTMHILAISGIHVSVIALLLFWILSRLLSFSDWYLTRFPLKKGAALFSIPILLFFGLLAGANTPVVRSVLMACMVLLALCTNRQKSPGPLLSAAALLLLIHDPLQLYAISFQLSFAAMGAILFLLPVLKQYLYPGTSESKPRLTIIIIKWLWAGLLVSLTATIVTAPITVSAFHRFSPLGLLSNLLIEPLICLWSLPAGLLSIPFTFISPEIAAFILQTGAIGIELALRAAGAFSTLPTSSIWMPPPSPAFLLIFYSTLILLLIEHQVHGTVRRSIALGLSFCLLFVFSQPYILKAAISPQPFRITYLDIGQGSSTLIEFPTGYRLLIDGGGSSSPTSTVGERIIAPYLWHRGIKRIDAIAITHPDADHYNGLEFIIRHFKPKVLWTRDTHGHEDAFMHLIARAKKEKVAVVVPKAGQTLTEGSSFLQCVENTADFVPEGVRQLHNNAGLILKACSGQFCAIFPGDIEAADEYNLLSSAKDVNATILLAAHHGSATSNTSAFVAAVAPQYIVVSAGRFKPDIFPSADLKKQAQEFKIPLFTTASHGTIDLSVSDGRVQFFGYIRDSANPLAPFKEQLLLENTN